MRSQSISAILAVKSSQHVFALLCALFVSALIANSSALSDENRRCRIAVVVHRTTRVNVYLVGCPLDGKLSVYNRKSNDDSPAFNIVLSDPNRAFKDRVIETTIYHEPEQYNYRTYNKSEGRIIFEAEYEFGGHKEKVTATYQLYPDWMGSLSALGRKMKVGSLAIPGTHLSGSVALDPNAKDNKDVQNYNIFTQLLFGIRHLDIELCIEPHHRHEFYICTQHSMGYSYEKALTEVSEFLNLYPTEVVFISVRQKGNTEPLHDVNAATMSNLKKHIYVMLNEVSSKKSLHFYCVSKEKRAVVYLEKPPTSSFLEPMSRVSRQLEYYSSDNNEALKHLSRAQTRSSNDDRYQNTLAVTDKFMEIDRFNKDLYFFLNHEKGFMDTAKIISVDNFEGTNIVAQCIQQNKIRENLTHEIVEELQTRRKSLVPSGNALYVYDDAQEDYLKILGCKRLLKMAGSADVRTYYNEFIRVTANRTLFNEQPISSAGWMGSLWKYIGKTLVADLTLPGTLNSGLYPSFYESGEHFQEFNVLSQLLAGVRALDFTLVVDRRGSAHVTDGHDSLQEFSEILEQIKYFLDSFKTEFVFIAITEIVHSVSTNRAEDDEAKVVLKEIYNSFDKSWIFDHTKMDKSALEMYTLSDMQSDGVRVILSSTQLNKIQPNIMPEIPKLTLNATLEPRIQLPQILKELAGLTGMFSTSMEMTKTPFVAPNVEEAAEMNYKIAALFHEGQIQNCFSIVYVSRFSDSDIVNLAIRSNLIRESKIAPIILINSWY